MRVFSQPEKRWLLKSVNIWSLEGVSEVLDIEFTKERIEKISPSSSKKASISLLPLGFDVQTHLRVPGQAEKETAETGLKAALVGGYGGILSMPNTQPVIDHPEILEKAKEEVRPAEEKWGIRAFFSSSLSRNLDGKELISFDEMIAAGALAFTDDGRGLESDELMASCFQALSGRSTPLLQHSEMSGHGGVLAPSSVQKKLGVKAYPDEPEIRMLERDLRLLKEFPGARYHLLHATSHRAVEMISRAKKEGLRVTAEVSPHHLFFHSEQIDPQNTAFKMNPPIRGDEDRQSLRQALAEGIFDFVATDHAPHAAHQKTTEFGPSAFGTIGLETCLPVLFSLYQESCLSPQRIVEVFSSKPLEFLGLQYLFPQKFREASPARFCLARPDSDIRVFEEAGIASLSKNSCFLGSKLPLGAVASVTDAGFFRWGDLPECEALS